MKGRSSTEDEQLRQRHPDKSKREEQETSCKGKESAHDLEFGGASYVIVNPHAMGVARWTPAGDGFQSAAAVKRVEESFVRKESFSRSAYTGHWRSAW